MRMTQTMSSVERASARFVRRRYAGSRANLSCRRSPEALRHVGWGWLPHVALNGLKPVLQKAAAIALALLCISASPASAAKEPQPTVEEVETAVRRATEFLVTMQDEESGYFSKSVKKRNKSSKNNKKKGKVVKFKKGGSHSTAMTALAIMGLTSVGHLPTDPTPEGRALASALDYVLSDEVFNEHGYFGKSDGSRMYGHGIITLMLAEMIGMGVDDEQDEKIRQRLEKAIELILKSQRVGKDKKYKGGWRYTPEARDADISVSVWQVMALRAAKNGGLDVPKNAIDDAIGYIKRSYRGEGKSEDENAPFAYQVNSGRMAFSTTAAGVLSLQVCGAYDAIEIKGGANFLLKSPPQHGDSWFFYGMYYYAQGMCQRGGEHADTGRQFAERVLLKIQGKDGSWEARNGSERSAGKVYSTCLALLSLSVQHQFLPIYQK